VHRYLNAWIAYPLAERWTYEAAKNIFFLNFEGLNVRSTDDIVRLHQAVADVLTPIGHKVYAIVNYDRFTILPELIDGYLAMVKTVVDTYYHDVTRYTSNAFLRVRLGEELEKRKLAPRVFGTASEAQASLPGSL